MGEIPNIVTSWFIISMEIPTVYIYIYIFTSPRLLHRQETRNSNACIQQDFFWGGLWGVVKSSWPRQPMGEPINVPLLRGNSGQKPLPSLQLTARLALKTGNPERKRSYSNHLFSGANCWLLLVSGRVKHIKTYYDWKSESHLNSA